MLIIKVLAPRVPFHKENIKMRNIIAGVLIILFSSACSAENYSFLMMDDFKASDDVDDFSYYQNQIIIDTKEKAVLSGHTMYPYKDCNSSKWLCVFSEVFNMAIPVSDIEEKKQWEKNGYTFVNKGQGVNYEGDDDGVFRILTYKEGANANLTLYSKQKGVIAITILYENKAETYWSIDGVGLK